MHAQGIDNSLRSLGVDTLDLVQFYWHDYSVPRYVGAAQRLQVIQHDLVLQDQYAAMLRRPNPSETPGSNARKHMWVLVGGGMLCEGHRMMRRSGDRRACRQLTTRPWLRRSCRRPARSGTSASQTSMWRA